MNFKSRIKLISGVIAVLALVAGLVLYVDKTSSVVAAQDAELQADSYTVGIDYSGNIVEQYVQEGDSVREGQLLFKVKSTVLTNSVKEFDLKETELLYPLDETGNIEIMANKDGIISEITYGKGSFVPANEGIATVVDIDELRAQATYRLPRKDFALLSRDTTMTVRLPDGSYASGTLTKIDVVEQNDFVIAEVQSEIDSGRAGEFLLGTSTPVTAELVLRPNNYYDRVIQFVQAMIKTIRE